MKKSKGSLKPPMQSVGSNGNGKPTNEKKLNPLDIPNMRTIRLTTKPEKKLLIPHSTSRLQAVNMCPTWGVVSAQKRYASSARSMALECGKLMHDVFAGVRIWQLEHIQGLRKHAEVTAHRILGRERWTKCKNNMTSKDDRDKLLELSFGILHTSGWEDSPTDRNRTMATMELASVEYVDERFSYMEDWPVYVENVRDPYGMVGIEQVFDVVVEFENDATVRYIGTIDGLVIKKPKDIYCLDENKTAARLDDGWRSSFELSHQITGYCAASTLVFGFPVSHSRVTGVKIGRGEDPNVVEPIARDKEFIQNWARWLYHSAAIYAAYKDNYELAPRYTHSCNRYFRPCALIPFCADTIAGRAEQWAQMIERDLTPSEEAILEASVA